MTPEQLRSQYTDWKTHGYKSSYERFLEEKVCSLHHEGRTTQETALLYVLTNRHTVEDLFKGLVQDTRTTKHDRREKALAYILDNYTGDPLNGNNHWLLARLHEVAATLSVRSPIAEVKVACDRVMRRCSYKLSEPQQGDSVCVACDAVILRQDIGKHQCDPKLIAHKERRTPDPTVMEVT